MTIHYDWFDAESSAAIRDALVAAGDGALLCLHPHPREDNPHGLLAKVSGGANPRPLDDGGTNNSHRCPPICP